MIQRYEITVPEAGNDVQIRATGVLLVVEQSPGAGADAPLAYLGRRDGDGLRMETLARYGTCSPFSTVWIRGTAATEGETVRFFVASNWCYRALVPQPKSAASTLSLDLDPLLSSDSVPLITNGTTVFNGGGTVEPSLGRLCYKHASSSGFITVAPNLTTINETEIHFLIVYARVFGGSGRYRYIQLGQSTEQEPEDSTATTGGVHLVMNSNNFTTQFRHQFFSPTVITDTTDPVAIWGHVKLEDETWTRRVQAWQAGWGTVEQSTGSVTNNVNFFGWGRYLDFGTTAPFMDVWKIRFAPGAPTGAELRAKCEAVLSELDGVTL